MIKTKKEIINLTKNLIKLNTNSYNFKALKIALLEIKKILKDYKFLEFKKNNYESLLFYNFLPKNKKFKLILNGHLDIIPAKESQFFPLIKEERLFGAGSLDMKGGLSVLVYIFKNYANKLKYPIALQVVTDEEIGGFNGTKYQIENNLLSEFVISSEPTNFDIVHKAKGIIWADIIINGVTAHSAYPWRGKNAIELTNKVINKLIKKFSNPKNDKWKTTINLATIKTENITYNKIPDKCILGFDIRYIPEEKKQILKKIKSCLNNYSNLEIKIFESSFYTKKNNAYIKKIKKIIKKITNNTAVLRGANGSSDIRHYNLIGIEGIEFGPKGFGIGSDNEYVEIESLEKYYLILEEFLKNF
ncbi:MAG: peptidase M20 [Patescibacteria group bacterium]|nr:MAG: peptidase M20 [Patescibacteria group bacterium]